MPAKFTMTWEPGPRRWRKMYRGTTYTISAHSLGCPETKLESYQAAREWWEKKKAEIDAQAAAEKPHRRHYEEALQTRRDMLEWMQIEGVLNDPEYRATRDRLREEIRKMEADFARPVPPPIPLMSDLVPFPIPTDDIQAYSDWWERVESIRAHRRWTQGVNHPGTVAAAVDNYLERRRADVGAGQIKPASYKAIRDRLPHFKTFAGGLDASKIDERTLSGYQVHLTAKVAAGDCSPQYASHLLASAASFIRHLWRERLLDHLPRNMDTLSIRVPPREITTFRLESLEIILDAASERTRLYLVLMANCGMYQSDVAALRPSQVDWRDGRITRKRTKAEAQANAPKVSYPLWDETFRLLKKFGKQSGPLALVNENSSPLYRRPVKEDGTVGNTDNIKKAYERTCKKLGMKVTPLMYLRKTSASLLETHETFSQFSQYYLGQAPQSLAEKRYAKPSPDQFDRAIRWLGLQYGFMTSR